MDPVEARAAVPSIMTEEDASEALSLLKSSPLMISISKKLGRSAACR